MFKKLKNWLGNNVDCGNDITVDLARANYLKFQKDLDKKRKDYIKALCQNIKDRSKIGGTCIHTIDFDDERMSPEFVAELISYFKQKGFKVDERDGVFTSWLTISW